MSNDIFKNIMLGLAGLGLFLVSIKFMSSSLKQMTGSKINKVMRVLKKNPFLACFVGVFFTTMIQSSDGSVALAIGLVVAGILDLKTAIAFILGANIGTATTSIIVAAADVDEFKFIKYSLFAFSFLGAFGLTVFNDDKKVRSSMLLFSVGSIFIGLEVMNLGFTQLANGMKDVFKKIENPFLALLISTIVTGTFQSSSAVVTIVQGFYGSNSEHMKIHTALAMMVGANIGTTFTSLIASIGSIKKDAKRIAVVWLITNIVMASIVMPLISIDNIAGNLIRKINTTQNNFDLAIGHLLFNTLLVILFIPFTKQLVWVANKIIKEPENYAKNKFNFELPNQLLRESPELALVAVKNATVEMGKMAYIAEKELSIYLKNGDKNHLQNFEYIHEILENVRINIGAYLVELGSKDISEKISNTHMSLVLSSRSLDIITRLGFDVGKLIKKTFNKKTKAFNINDQSIKELIQLMEILKNMIKRSYKQVHKYYLWRSKEIKELKISFEKTAKKFIKNNISRIKNKNNNYVFDFENVVKILIRISHHAFRVNEYQTNGRTQRKTVKLF